jgi:ligand-binding sensor domain-containing protein/signal transduction histidine kinase
MCVFIAFCCSHPRSSIPENTDRKNENTYKSPKYSLANPVVTFITTRNQPAITIAGKPIIKTDSSGAGISFFSNYNTDQGLLVNNIICSSTDRAGNLWFGTGGGGISKYDGKSFTNYTMTQGLASNVVFSIVEDNDDNIWIGSTSGVTKYDGKRFVNFSTLQGLAGNFVTCILQDQKHNIWFGTHDAGVSKYDGKTFRNYTVGDGLTSNNIRCMFQDKEGNLWFGSDAGGAGKYNGNRFVHYAATDGLASNSVNTIIQDRFGNLWFGTNKGASMFNGKVFKNYTTKDGLADNDISCIVQSQNGELWFGTHANGVSRYDGKLFHNYPKTEGLPDDKINSMTLDRTGNLWITSEGGGVSKYGGKSFTNYTTTQGLGSNLVFSIMEDKAESLWFGTFNGISQYDGKRFANYNKEQGVPDVHIWSILQDKAGNIWFGTDLAGACKFDGKTFTDYTTAQGLAGNAVINLMQDREGNIWFGTRGKGISKFDGKSFTSYPTIKGLATSNVFKMLQDKTGTIWFATHGQGLFKFDGIGFTNYTSEQGLAGDAVTSIVEDKYGYLWFATDGNGVSKYDGERFINYSTQQGLSDNLISSMLEDTLRDMIWFATAQGLSGVKENALFTTKGNDLHFENFNKNTGYPIKDLSNGVVFVDSKGIVWAASTEGKLIRFDYDARIKNNKASLNVAIQGIKLNNENICWNNLIRNSQGKKVPDSLALLNEMVTTFGNVLPSAVLDSLSEKYSNVQFDSLTKFYPVPVNLVLPYQYNNISIDFLAIEPAMPKQVKYQYKMEGYGSDWSSLSNSTIAVFGNLRPGNYVFKLKAVSPYGIWSEMEYRFTVLPPWWLTWWAWALYILLIAALLYSFFQNRIRILKRRQEAQIAIILNTQEEERKRIAQDLHDDIGARLTNINMLSMLGQQKANEPREMSDYLKRISTEIQISGEALDDIVWSIDTKNNSMEEVTARMRRYATDVFDETGIRYSITIDDRFLPDTLSANKRRDLFLVFKEVINNIQKHAAATNVSIIMEANTDRLYVQITDNGKGFNTEQPTYRHGLKNMQQRMHKWGGSYTIFSSPGNGTITKISLPVFSPSLKKGILSWLKKK